MMTLPTIPSDVKRLLSLLNLTSTPMNVNVIPKKHSIESECFPNVKKQIELEGGHIVYGWQLWQSGNHFIEAEFHAVWKDLQGNFQDITPKPFNRFPQILFVIDANRSYEGKQINNVRLNLSGNRLVDQFIQLNDMKFQIENEGDRADQHELTLTGEDAQVYNAVINMLMSIEPYMHSGATLRSPCFCGSGEKYKKCHGEVAGRFITSYTDWKTASSNQ